MTEPRDAAQLVVQEKAILQKFDGDYTQAELDELEPEIIEQITLVDGEITDHWKKGDTNRNPNAGRKMKSKGASPRTK